MRWKFDGRPATAARCMLSRMVLTGSAGVQAVQVYMTLGAQDARFDRGKVARALASSRSRLRLLQALRTFKPLRGLLRGKILRPARLSARRRASRPGGSQKPTGAPARPARPRDPWHYVGAPEEPQFEWDVRDAD